MSLISAPRCNHTIAQPLIRTKLLVPRARPDLVHRARLVSQLNMGVQRALTLVTAPAGFGKTTLLVEWAAQQAMPLAWLSLDQQDNDPQRFLSYLAKAVEPLLPVTGADFGDLRHSIQAFSMQSSLTLLINALAELADDVALILDEYHCILNEDIHRGVEFLIDHLPPSLHLIIASRTEPMLALHRLRGRDQVIELRTADLRFSGAETDAFLRHIMGLDLSAETVAAIDARAEGWVTGLQFAALTLREDTESATNTANALAVLSGHNRYILDFMAAEVLQQQPDEVQQFLLRTSILDNLSGALCDAVAYPDAPSGHGQAMLERLYRSNLFIAALDDERKWYRYHTLFSDFLRQVLGERYASEVPELHRLASMWYRCHGSTELAVRHTLDAGDFAGAADLLDWQFETILQTGSMQTVLGWIKRLPVEWVRQRPGLCLIKAWGLITSYDFDQADTWIDAAARAVAPYTVEMPAREVAFETKAILGQIEICTALIATLRGQGARSLEMLRHALEYLPPESLFYRNIAGLERGVFHIFNGDVRSAEQAFLETIRIGQPAGNVLVLTLARAALAEAQYIQGHLTRAMSTYRQAIQFSQGPDGNSLTIAEVLYIGLGDVLRERDELELAEQYLRQGIDLGNSWLPASVLDGHIALARLLQSKGDPDGAATSISAAYRLADMTEASQWDDLITSTWAARLALQQGRLQAALNWASQEDLLDTTSRSCPERRPFQIHELVQLSLARLWVALSRYERQDSYARHALEILNALMPQVESLGRLGSLNEVRMLLALAYQEVGQTEQALTCLSPVLAQAELEGYARILLDEGTPVARLIALQLSAQRRSPVETQFPSTGFLRQLLERFARDAIGTSMVHTTPEQCGGNSVPASPSEREVLRIQHAQAEFIEALTPRELDVLRLIATGASNRDIALELCLALNTVKRHVNNIFSKLGVTGRTHAAARARELGLLD